MLYKMYQRDSLIRDGLSGCWYKKGLRFQCQQCGHCCRGKPGVVWVNKEEIIRISNYLKIPINKFGKGYLRRIDTRYSLIELSNSDCIMYDDGCKIYPVRPYQCYSFPFWLDNVETRVAWESLKDFCPGIDKGRLYSFEKIMEIIRVAEYV